MLECWLLRGLERSVHEMLVTEHLHQKVYGAAFGQLWE